MSRTATLAALYSLGAYVFTFSPPWLGRQQTLGGIGESLQGSLTRQWSVGPPELGAIFLLFAFICWADREPAFPRRAAVDTVCCLLMVAITAPALLILVPFGWAALRVQRRMALVVLAGGWILLALLTTIPGLGFPQQNPLLLTLPIGLALLCGFLFCVLTQLIRVQPEGQVEAALFIFLFLASSIAFLLERDVGGQYIEYDVAARKTLEIASRFPRQRWLIVAPVEQSSETYGLGGYADLAKFVTQYEDRAGDPDLDFVSPADDLFVYVEKRPFRTFAVEPKLVPFSALVDATYRDYRSPAGRTSIGFSALQMCESYRRAHANASIYYEDDVLRIYHFRRMEPSLAETAPKKPESEPSVAKPSTHPPIAPQVDALSVAKPSTHPPIAPQVDALSVAKPPTHPRIALQVDALSVAKPSTHPRIALQVGAFEERANADALSWQLSTRYHQTALISPAEVHGRILYKVSILFETKEEAELLATTLRREQKISSWIVALP